MNEPELEIIINDNLTTLDKMKAAHMATQMIRSRKGKTTIKYGKLNAKHDPI